MQGPVLQPFAYDESHPYAAGQHRGIDIAAAAGEEVAAPAAGAVSFAGSVPTSGQSVTIETDDGYSVTLTHLGSIAVSKGASVAEGDPVGTIGPSGTPEVDGPYVHLGIRLTSDQNGYLDPLRFLPSPPASVPAPQSAPPVSQPSASATTPSAAPAPAPTTPAPGASASTTPATARGANVRATQSSTRSRRVSGRAARSPSSDSASRELQRPGSSQQAVRHSVDGEGRAQVHLATPHQRIDASTSAVRRPAVEAGAPTARLRLDSGHELRPPGHGGQVPRPATATSSRLLPVVCIGVAALVALAAAFAAGQGARRRRADGCPAAQVFHLPRTTADGERGRCAA